MHESASGPYLPCLPYSTSAASQQQTNGRQRARRQRNPKYLLFPQLAPRFPALLYLWPSQTVFVSERVASLCRSLQEQRRACPPASISPVPIRLFSEFMESIRGI